jgi:hypothetical protein
VPALASTKKVRPKSTTASRASLSDSSCVIGYAYLISLSSASRAARGDAHFSALR